MANIINITRTYRFIDGIPLVNNQVESEFQNIVERVNKNISYVTSNVYLSTTATGSTPATSVYGDVVSLAIPAGEWDVQAATSFSYSANGTGSDNVSYNTGLGYTSGNTAPSTDFPFNVSSLRPYIDFTLNRTSNTYLTMPPSRFNSTPAGITLYLKIMAVYDNTKLNSLTPTGSIVARKVNT